MSKKLMSVGLSFHRVYPISKGWKYACISQSLKMGEVEDYWDKNNSNKFCSRQLFLILKLFQDIGTYPHIRSKEGRHERIQK